MPSYEIERKFLLKQLPKDMTSFAYHEIEQAYLCTDPVVRIRKEDNSFYLTYKGGGLIKHVEYNLPLTEESYTHLKKKADGNVISKRRYLIPLHNPQFMTHMSSGDFSKELTIEVDVFHAPFAPLILAEVEFASEEEAAAFIMPDWFLKDVSSDSAYHNSTMSLQLL